MRLRTIQFIVLFYGLLLASGTGRAQAPPPSESQLKAAFLYNFAKFVDWPAQAFANDTAPFIIGILGDNPLAGDLVNTVSGKKISEHPITIQKFEDPAEAAKCHILFISGSEKKRLGEIIEKLKGSAVLTVGDTDRFIESGGIINFVQEASKIRFQINDEAAKSIKLKISSKLLSLAVATPR